MVCVSISLVERGIRSVNVPARITLSRSFSKIEMRGRGLDAWPQAEIIGVYSAVS